MARTGVLWLLVGSAWSIALAWGIALLESSARSPAFAAILDGRARSMVADWPDEPPSDWSADDRMSMFEVSAPWSRCRWWVSAWPLEGGVIGASTREYHVVAWEVGLPCRCMSWQAWTRESASREFEFAERSVWRSGIRLQDARRSRLGNPMRLPLTIRWPEFVADSVFWGLLLWAIAGGPRRLRTARRSALGRCVACGYDLKGSVGGVCPECGRGAATSPP